jgi:hypothetical protein
LEINLILYIDISGLFRWFGLVPDRAVDDIADIPILTIRYRQTIRYRLFLNLSMPIAGTISAGFKFDDIVSDDIVISYRHRHIFPSELII